MSASTNRDAALLGCASFAVLLLGLAITYHGLHAGPVYEDPGCCYLVQPDPVVVASGSVSVITAITGLVTSIAGLIGSVTALMTLRNSRRQFSSRGQDNGPDPSTPDAE